MSTTPVIYAAALKRAKQTTIVYADNGRGIMRMGVIVHDNHRYYTVRDAPFWKRKAFGFFAAEWTAIEQGDVHDIELVYNAKLKEGVRKSIFTISVEKALAVRTSRADFAGGGYFIPMDAFIPQEGE